MLKSCYVALILFAFAFTMQVLFTTSAKFKINAEEFTSQIAPQNIKYVGGSVWLASTVGVYSPAKPQVMFLMQEKMSLNFLVIRTPTILYKNNKADKSAASP